MLRDYLNRIKPNFEPGGKLHSFQSVFEGFESFLYTPTSTAGVKGVHVHDSLDSKRVMIIVVIALMPCLLFGMYNTGYQNFIGSGLQPEFWPMMLYGFLAILPRIVVTYLVGLGIEFIVAQWRHEEIQEGFLVTGILIPLICPIETPIWMMAVATAFSVIFIKEVFGGTGYNIFNVALMARAFLFFSYPSQMSGDKVFIASNPICGIGGTVNYGADGISGATPLGQIASHTDGPLVLNNILGDPLSSLDAFIGLIPGSFGETSTLCILIGALILLATGIANWRIMLSMALGGLLMGWIANEFQSPTYPGSMLSPLDQLLYGGFAFATVFMATDPVTSARTGLGKYIYGFLTGVIAVIIRVYNNGYPEGAMLAVLLMNAFAPLIDYCVVQANINRRLRRLKAQS